MIRSAQTCVINQHRYLTMRNLFGKIKLALLGLFVCGVATAATYVGFNPTSGQVGLAGALVDLSASPTITMTGQTISAQKGGQNAGTFTATGATTGASTFTFPVAAPNGWVCQVADLTTTADKVVQATSTTTTATFTGTVVSGDKFVYLCQAF